MKNWNRGDWFDSTGLHWVDPSPNMRSLTGAILYPGVGMLESSTNYSVGRGTDVPFEVIGSEATVHDLAAGEDPRAIVQRLEGPLENFLKMRDKYLLYR